MNEELKRRAYLEGMRLMKAGCDAQTIRDRLSKEDIPDELIIQVLKNLFIVQKTELVEKEKFKFETELIKIGIGIVLALGSYLLWPDRIEISISLIGGGIIAAFISKAKMK